MSVAFVCNRGFIQPHPDCRDTVKLHVVKAVYTAAVCLEVGTELVPGPLCVTPRPPPYCTLLV